MARGAIGQDELARLQQHVLAAALSGGTLPDLQFARQGQELVLSRTNLAEPLDLTVLPQAVRLITPGDRREAVAAAGHLEFTPPKIEGGQLMLSLQVRATPPGGTDTVPLSAVTLRFEQRDGAWTPAGPPAALSA